jgi:hypothetical protein
MRHLTKSYYGQHIGKGCGCGITIPSPGFEHGSKARRNVWTSRKWGPKEAEAEMNRAYRRRLLLQLHAPAKESPAAVAESIPDENGEIELG